MQTCPFGIEVPAAIAGHTKSEEEMFSSLIHAQGCNEHAVFSLDDANIAS